MSVWRYRTPGVYREEFFPAAPEELHTGVPAFLGFVRDDAPPEMFRTPWLVSHWNQFVAEFVNQPARSYLERAVRGFFRNGGDFCYIMPLRAANPDALTGALGRLDELHEIDLICAPDIMAPDAEGNTLSAGQIVELQSLILAYCTNRGNLFAIFDSLPGADREHVFTQRRLLLGDAGKNCALYYPWIRIVDAPADDPMPPCGHIAGIYRRTDYQIGVHKAPANEVIEDVLDLELQLTNQDQAQLNPAGINCLRARPGRGIRIWGARTLSVDPSWVFINTRRLLFKLSRWIDLNLNEVTFELHTPQIWTFIENELTVYLNSLVEAGQLLEFYVKCDEETNSAANRDQGTVTTEIGLAPAVPAEFIVVRVMHGESGIITG